MSWNKTQTSPLFQYRLETFIESRSTEWSHEPYSGEHFFTLRIIRILSSMMTHASQLSSILLITWYNVLFGPGQPVDAYSQPPPGPWDIPAKPPSFFMDSKQVIKVPYTSSVKVNYKTCFAKIKDLIAFRVILLTRNISQTGMSYLCGNGKNALQRLCRVWECEYFPIIETSLERESYHRISFFFWSC